MALRPGLAAGLPLSTRRRTRSALNRSKKQVKSEVEKVIEKLTLKLQETYPDFARLSKTAKEISALRKLSSACFCARRVGCDGSTLV
jgi:hypothetical protein